MNVNLFILMYPPTVLLLVSVDGRWRRSRSRGYSSFIRRLFALDAWWEGDRRVHSSWGANVGGVRLEQESKWYKWKRWKKVIGKMGLLWAYLWWFGGSEGIPYGLGESLSPSLARERVFIEGINRTIWTAMLSRHPKKDSVDHNDLND